MRHPGRVALLLLLLLGGAAAWEARRFVVGFPTDPLGPRAFPWFASALLVLCAGVALRLPRAAPPVRMEGEDPHGAEGAVDATGPDGEPATGDAAAPAPADDDPLPALLRPVLAALSFLAFALLLEPLGFVVATTLEFGVLALLFRGRLLPGLAAGAAFAVVSFLFFVQLLGLPLPLGFWMGAP